MPQSRFDKMRERMNQPKEVKIPEQKSDYCIGKCDVQVIGVDENTKKPLVYCMGGCGRNMGR